MNDHPVSTIPPAGATPRATLDVVRRVEVLSRRECEAVRDAVFAHRDAWERNLKEAPFYVLGAASYLHATHGRLRGYLERAQCYNPLLRGTFGWLYERLLAVLGDVLQAPARYHPAYGLPGFHVFLSDPFFEQPIASIHFDQQYETLDWSGFDDVAFDDPLSFTLSVALPGRGGGLYVWDAVRYGETVDIERDMQATRRHFQPYREGEMVCHSGRVLHQIAPSTGLAPGDVRLTLQGHGLRCDGAWQLYW